MKDIGVVYCEINNLTCSGLASLLGVLPGKDP